MKREEINNQYKWDLSSLFENQMAFDSAVEQAYSLLEQLKAMKGNLACDIEHFIDYMETSERYMVLLQNITTYPHLCCDVEPEDEQNQQNQAVALLLASKSETELAFADLELIESKAKIDMYLQDERCRDYTYPISKIWKTIPHRLDEAGEKMLAELAELFENSQRTYQSFRPQFEDVMVDGKPQFLNGATYRSFLQNPDQKVRKQAYENYFGKYKEYGNAFANMLIGHTKGQIKMAKLRHFDSALQASLSLDDATETLFNKVCDMANKKYIHAFHEYNALKKELLGLEHLNYYDLNVPLVESVNQKYTPEESYDILFEALKPLGDDYIALLHRAQDEHWIDFMTHEGKRQGAYSSGTYTSNPCILMNFTGSYDSLSTMAHELGHSMHSYYSHTNNRAMTGHYRIFVAEVASTVNEILLNRYLLNTSDDKEYKAYILYNLLEQLLGTLYRQPMFAQFEAQLNEKIEKGEAVSNKTCMDLFLKLNQEHYGPAVEIDENLHGAGCYYIPHFYYNFYVYKYTLGMSLALSFAKRILNGDVDDYKKFLTLGGSMSPIDELILVKADPNKDQVYDDAFTFFEETMNEFKELMK